MTNSRISNKSFLHDFTGVFFAVNLLIHHKRIYVTSNIFKSLVYFINHEVNTHRQSFFPWKFLNMECSEMSEMRTLRRSLRLYKLKAFDQTRCDTILALENLSIEGIMHLHKYVNELNYFVGKIWLDCNCFVC